MEEKSASKVDEILKRLNEGVSNLYESDRYKKYLDVMSKFHNYSVNNCLLISMQRPDASYVAGYCAWRDKFHRYVLKGEKGITIISPTPYKKTHKVQVRDADGVPILDKDGNPVTEEKEYVHQAFRATTVFDVSQTDGEPLPSMVGELLDPVEGYDEYLDVIKELSPVPVKFDEIKSGAKGYFSPKKQEIVIQRGMSEEQTIKTLLHECAHSRLGHGGDDDHSDKRTHEVQAESVAYVCCKALGIDTSEYSFGYIAGWSSGKEQKELKASLQTIRDQADQMIKGIEEKISHVMELRTEKLASETPKFYTEGIKIAM